MSIEKDWFNKGEWKEGLQLNVHPSVNLSRFYRQYHKRPDLWKAAFQYLSTGLSEVEAGKYPLKGDEAVALVSEYQTKKQEDAKWESHRKFIDLQYVINGEEKMGLLPLEKSKLAGEYRKDQDVILFGEQEGEYFVANPGVFFLFFPDDVHRPCIRIGDSVPVKKLVIKIAVAD